MMNEASLSKTLTLYQLQGCYCVTDNIVDFPVVAAKAKENFLMGINKIFN